MKATSDHGRYYPVGLEGVALPEFGLAEANITVRSILLDNERNQVEFNLGGSFIWAYAASDLNANIDVYLNNRINAPLNFSQGMLIKGSKFNRLFVTNTAQAGKYITFVVCDNPNVDIKNPDKSASTITTTKASVFDSVADVACADGAATQVAPANTDRRMLYITNPPTAGGLVRVGDINVAVDRGTILLPSDTFCVETSEAVYIRNDTGGAIDIAVTWTED